MAANSLSVAGRTSPPLFLSNKRKEFNFFQIGEGGGRLLYFQPFVGNESLSELIENFGNLFGGLRSKTNKEIEMIELKKEMKKFILQFQLLLQFFLFVVI